MTPLEHCASPSHRAVAGLLAAAIGRPASPVLIADLSGSPPEALAEIAYAHHVDPALASAWRHDPKIAGLLPRDLQIFFSEMQAANRRRNLAIRDQLLVIGKVASSLDIELVALKGAAELLEPVHPDPSHRYISDLDVLVPPTAFHRTRELVDALGAREAADADPNPPDHHHLPPVTREDWPVLVEFHRELGPSQIVAILPASAVVARSVPGGHPGLRLPASEDRLAHLVLHALVATERYGRYQVSLRDCLEFEALTQGLSAAEREATREILSEGAGSAFDGLEAVTCALFRPEAWLSLTDGGRDWAERALRVFGRPDEQRRLENREWMVTYARELFLNPERRRHYVRKILRPGGLRQWIRFHRDRNDRIR